LEDTLEFLYPLLDLHYNNNQTSVKAEKLQDKHSKRIEEVKGDLSNKFKNTEVTGRVKTTYSMLEKLARKPEYESVSDLQDVSGIRTLCKDLKEVGKVTSYIRKNYDVVDEDNYIHLRS